MTAGMDDLIYEALNHRATAIGYYLSRRVAELFPDRAVLEGNHPHAFDLEAFAKAGLCTLSQRTVPHPQRVTYWFGPESGGQLDRPQNVLFDVDWQGEQFAVLITHWQDNNGPYHYFIVAGSADAAERFHLAVCEWNTPIPDDYILVFDVNGWSRDESLLAAIANTTLDTLVLRGSMKEDIVGDLTAFFAARDAYAEYGVPWKRGILLLGPPGNGKTHAVKALVNHLGQRCVYVKTFAAGMPDQFGIREIFSQARRIAPCLLVLEDIDSLLTSTNRSYFLNELDGFAGNDGILTLATSNHPERLDPAVVERPSRFDRKYPFDLPLLEERHRYIAAWNASLRPALQLTDDAVRAVAESTDGFSFAYLKELFLSAMMRWIVDPQPGRMDAVMGEQIAVLRDQMTTVMDLLPDPDYGPPGGGMMHHRRGGRGPHTFGGHQGPGPGDIPL